MNYDALTNLQARLAKEPQKNYPVYSRIHLLNSFNQSFRARCFVKREDELGFGISGSKFRKYRTLLPYLQERRYREVVIIGGLFSNHVLAITQLLLESGIKPTLFLKGSSPSEAQGNFLYLQMLVPKSSIHWIAKAEWTNVERHASNYAAEQIDTLVLPEGCTFFPAFLGALTLPLDIIKNESECGFTFDHLFIESGTGWSAAALLLAFAYLEKMTFCHLLLLAGEKENFLQQLQMLHASFELWLGIKCPFPERFTCENSAIATSFGSTNTAIFEFLIEMARAEGFFLDPIYSGKLFYHAKTKIEDEQMSGNLLLIHSGGGLTLAGFQKFLAKLVV